MPTYYHNGSNWQLFSSTSDTATSDEIYVNTGSGFTTRVLEASIHNGVTWTPVFTAFTSPPAAPVLDFSSTSQNERNNAFLSWEAVSGATSYRLYLNDQFYGSTSSTSITVPVSPNNSDSSFTAYNFRLTAVNSYGESSLSNRKTMVPGGTDVPWSATYASGVQTTLADVTATSNQNQGYIASMTFPSASNSTQAGYYRIDYWSVQILASNTASMAAPTSTTRRMGLIIGTSAQTLSNIVYEETSRSGIYEWTTRGGNVNLNSNNFGNKKFYWMVDGNSDGVSDWTTSSNMNLNFAYYARSLYLQGVRSTASTYS